MEHNAEARAKIIYDGKEGDIIHQYVTFTKVCQKQVSKWMLLAKHTLPNNKRQSKNFFADFLYNRVPAEITIANITTLYCIGAK